MGLNTTHNAWDGPCSSFNEWRTEVAKHIGMNLREMEGYEGDKSWSPYEKHPLYSLLTHSDCDGTLNPEECKLIADGLKEILPKIGNEYPNDSFYSKYLKEKTENFIKGCELAFSKNESIEFH